MKNAKNEFDELEKNKKIALLKSQSAHLMQFLTKPAEELNDKELGNLRDLGELEKASKEASHEMYSNLSSMIQPFSKTFDDNLKKLKLNKSELLLVDSIFKKTILFGITKASDKLFDDLKENKGFLYNQMVSERTLDVLDSILDFKKEIDQNFPGLSDKILSIAAPIIVAAISYCVPPVGIALKATGVLDKTASFLKTENLEQTIDKIRSDLHEVKQNGQIKNLEKRSKITAEVAKKSNIPATALEKLGLTKESLEATLKEVNQSPESKALLQDLCEYAKTHIPSNKLEVNKIMDSIQQSALQELEKSGASQEMVEDAKKILEASFAKATVEIYSTLGQDSKPLDKLSANQKSSDILIKAAAKMSEIMIQKYPQHSQAVKSASASLEKNAKKQVAGNISKIATKLINNSKSKGFSKETLGAGLANEIMLKRSVASKSAGRGV
ncbi:hypothetical protein N9N97_02325 [Rickettsiaceae bacterium]|nr:hypothetical protein [Rickettsiaceae bacterium]